MSDNKAMRIGSRTRLRIVVIALAAAAAPAARGEPTDADFIAARDAFRAGDAPRLERD